MLADERSQVLVDVLVMNDQIALVDELARAVGTLPALLSKMTRDMAIQVSLRLERGAARHTLEVLSRQGERKN